MEAYAIYPAKVEIERLTMNLILSILAAGILASKAQASAVATLRSIGESQELFQKLPLLNNQSYDEQCFLRAHAWARILEQDHDVNAGKAFVLLTPILQRNIGTNWWYHVAPFVYVGGSSSENIHVLDPALAAKPMNLRDWGKRFDPRGCVIGTTLDDYDAELFNGSCVIFLKTRFAFTPSDISAPDSSRWDCRHWSKVTQFLDRESVHSAYLTPSYCP